MSNKLNVAELFAGVGGFRVGFERASSSFFKTVYANQWEPSTTKQHSFEVYEDHFGKTNKKQMHENIDIAKVNDELEKDANYIPFEIDLLVGGFPCQDYSVATNKAKGIEGKKGVLWWEIIKFIEIKKPKYLLLENVDRLLISPKEQRGRDFLIMLKTLDNNGYDVEWRVITASEYGFSQRRKRVFIFASKAGSKINQNYQNNLLDNLNKTVLTKGLKIEKVDSEILDLDMRKNDLQKISNTWKINIFNYGFMQEGILHTLKAKPDYHGETKSLEDILEKNVNKKYYLTSEQQKRIFALKNGGKKVRTTKDGFTYNYTEGKMSHFDNYDNKPSRTMLTSEGTINRSTHIIKEKNKYRFLTPIEAERLDGFDDNWTSSVESINRRYWIMGNALVTNVIEKIAKEIIKQEKK